MAAGDVTLTAVQLKALVARTEATELEGGSFTGPEQKTAELAAILRTILDATTIT